jgi:hypothetical protein
MRLDSSGNVGIGTSAPAVSGIEISRATGVAPTAPAELRISTSTNGADWSTTNAWGRISFYNADTNDEGPKNHWDISTIAEFASGSNSVLSFANYPSNVRTEAMRINSAGRVGIGTSSPDASAILDVQSTTKGVRMPNMTTTEKNAISSPAAGLMVYDTTLAKLCVYTTAWETITSL